MLKKKEKLELESRGQVNPCEKVDGSLTADQYLDMACDHFGVIDKTIRTYGGHQLYEYLNTIQQVPRQAFQSKNDLLAVVREYVTPLLGDLIAKQAAEDIERSPLVLTANHHGVAYFSQDFQGGIIFSINRMSDQGNFRTVPIFSCGTVPLNNITYPLGLLCYRSVDKNFSLVPRKIPIFPNRMKRQMVSCTGPFDQDMLNRAQHRVHNLIKDQILSDTLNHPIQTLLSEEYCKSTVINLPSYSQQAVALNYAIWKRLFNDRQRAPELVAIELEEISNRLLLHDIGNNNSLVHCVLFDAELRKNVLKELDGKRACWKTKKLLSRLHADYSGKNTVPAASGCGTMLFWGLDNRGWRIPLYFNPEFSKKETLCGIDDRGNALEMPFSVKSIREGLVNKKILPSLFTSMLVISMARGVTCAGGYFQCDYLPAMQQGLVKALKNTGGYDLAAQSLANIPTDTYLSGMIAVMSRIDANAIVPAGPLEIIAANGLNNSDLERMQSLTIKDMHLSALSETLPDLPAEKQKTLPPNWKAELADDLAHRLNGNIIIK
jgi:hypothetical protein